MLFDSGIRGGADVFKALALGAAAVLLGRPYVYGARARAARPACASVLRNLVADFDLTMAARRLPLGGGRSGPECLELGR